MLVYAQEDAYVEQPHEGFVNVVPMKWLLGDIERAHADVDWDTRFRIASALWSHLPPDDHNAFEAEWSRVAADFKAARENGREQPAQGYGTEEGRVPDPAVDQPGTAS